MDELELRLAAVETAVIEVFAELDPVALARAKARLNDFRRMTASDDEVVIREGSTKLIEDAERGFGQRTLTSL